MYNCTGNPHPRDIERVVQSMMADEFGTAYSREFFIVISAAVGGWRLAVATDVQILNAKWMLAFFFFAKKKKI